MVEKIEQYMRKNKMLEETEGIVLGLSGGADSVCLFLILKRLAEKMNFTLRAVHVNHGIRGAEGARDEEFCRELCKQYGIQFKAVRADIPRIAAEEKMSEEEAGRKIRYEAFEQAARELALERKTAAGRIKTAVAHHMDDQAETVLFHMFRGSRIQGMGGMHPVQNQIIRPLLCVRREEIEGFLRREKQAFCTDSTNAESDYARNILRNKVFPTVTGQINERAVENICAAAEHMQELGAYIRQETKKYQKECVVWQAQSAVVDLGVFGGLPVFLQKALLYEILCQAADARKDIGNVHVEALQKLSLGQSGKKINLPYGVEAVREYDRLWIGIPRIKNAENEWHLTCERTESGTGESGNKHEQEKNVENICTKIIDCDKIQNRLSIRTRQPGDFIVIGRKGEKKSVNRYFIDEKIPRKERDQIPIVFDGAEAVWIVGRRLSSRYRPGPDTIHTALLTVHTRHGENNEEDTGIN